MKTELFTDTFEAPNHISSRAIIKLRKRFRRKDNEENNRRKFTEETIAIVDAYTRFL